MSEMDKKTSDMVSNICTILGGALLLYPLIEQATKKLIPEIQKLTSADMTQELKALPAASETQPQHQPQYQQPQMPQQPQQPMPQQQPQQHYTENQ